MRRLFLLLSLLAVIAGAAPALAGSVRAPLGRDGRLTLLLLGSDLRSYPPRSERTDTIIVVSIEPVSGATTVVSLPRDVEGLPLPGPAAPAAERVVEWTSDRYDGKVNALMGSLVARIRARDKVGYEEAVRRALGPLRRTFGYAIGVEIDGVAIAAFGTIRGMAARLGGEIEIELPARLRFRDCSTTIGAADGCIDYRPTIAKGASSAPIRVPANEWLGFLRSRKADNDYARAARGQLFVAGMVARLRAEGPTVAIDALATLATTRGLLRTDLNLLAAPDLWAIMSRADLAGARQAVFGPSTYAREGTRLYQVIINTVAVRGYLDSRLPPTGLSGAWPLPFAMAPALPVRLYPEDWTPRCLYRSARLCLR